jgi:hypothetical protein
MHQSIAPISLAAAAAIFLTGCGGPAPSSTGSTTAEPSSASAAPTSPAKAYTNEDLTAIVTGLKDAQGRALTVVPAAQVDQGLPVARESEAAIRGCSTYTVELKGQKITSAMKTLEVPVEAEKSISALQTQTLPTGQKQAVLTVTGVKGTLAATVVKTGATGAVTASAAPELARLVSAALAAG